MEKGRQGGGGFPWTLSRQTRKPNHVTGHTKPRVACWTDRLCFLTGGKQDLAPGRVPGLLRAADEVRLLLNGGLG